MEVPHLPARKQLRLRATTRKTRRHENPAAQARLLRFQAVYAGESWAAVSHKQRPTCIELIGGNLPPWVGAAGRAPNKCPPRCIAHDLPLCPRRCAQSMFDQLQPLLRQASEHSRPETPTPKPTKQLARAAQTPIKADPARRDRAHGCRDAIPMRSSANKASACCCPGHSRLCQALPSMGDHLSLGSKGLHICDGLSPSKDSRTNTPLAAKSDLLSRPAPRALGSLSAHGHSLRGCGERLPWMAGHGASRGAACAATTDRASPPSPGLHPVPKITVARAH